MTHQAFPFLRRSGRSFRLALVLTSLLVGCSALGKETPFPDPISTSGVGPFRRLGTTETRFRGLALDLGQQGLDRASWAGGSLFYAAAPVIAPLPARDTTLPARELDPGQFDPFRIFRSDTEERFGFVAPTSFDQGLHETIVVPVAGVQLRT